MNDAPQFSLELEQPDEYEFRVRFDTPQDNDLLLDESPPLGKGRGPNPARLVAAAVTHCVSSSPISSSTTPATKSGRAGGKVA